MVSPADTETGGYILRCNKPRCIHRQGKSLQHTVTSSGISLLAIVWPHQQRLDLDLDHLLLFLPPKYVAVHSAQLQHHFLTSMEFYVGRPNQKIHIFNLNIFATWRERFCKTPGYKRAIMYMKEPFSKYLKEQFVRDFEKLTRRYRVRLLKSYPVKKYIL